MRRSKKQEFKTEKTLYIYLVLVSCAIWLGFLNKQFPIQRANAQIVSPLPKAVAVTLPLEKIATVTLTPTPTAKPDQLEEIKAHIKTIFGKDAKMALAVAEGECRGLRPNCKLVTPREHSVCQFQINIKAHSAKIPGNSVEEKEAWLKNPFNCNVMAKIIFDASGWYPWTAYTSGAYQAFLK